MKIEAGWYRLRVAVGEQRDEDTHKEMGLRAGDLIEVMPQKSDGSFWVLFYSKRGKYKGSITVRRTTFEDALVARLSPLEQLAMEGK